VSPTPESNHSKYRLDKRGWLILQIVLISLAGVSVYANSLQGGFVMDDYMSIISHGPNGFLAELQSGGMRRIVNATFVLNYSLHDLDVFGYHLVNMGIHIVAALVASFIARSALTALHRSHTAQQPSVASFVDRFVPLSVGLIFVLHPAQTQAVSYIVQRYSSLATLFYLLTALMFIRTRLLFDDNRGARCTLIAASATMISAALAFGCKEISVTLPLMLVFLELYLFQGRLLTRRFFIMCGVLTLLGLTVVIFKANIHSFHDFITTLDRVTAENHYIPRTTYFLTQLCVMATYLRLLCLPFGQSVLYDYPIHSTLLSTPVMAALALHLALLTVSVLLYRKSGQKRSGDNASSAHLQRLVALGIVWFYCTMIVESSIFPITDLIFEHRLYLPSFGFFLAVSAGAAWAVHTYTSRLRFAWVLLSLSCLILGSLTVSRNQLWSNPLALWQDTVNKSPNEDLALANLAGEYMKIDKPDLALPLFVKALEINPDFHPRTKIYLGKCLKYLAIDSSRFTTGEELAQAGSVPNTETVKPEDEKKLLGVLLNNLALSHEIMGHIEKARTGYLKALQATPDYSPPWYNIGMLSLKTGDKQQLDAALQQLKRLSPADADKLSEAMRTRSMPS